MHALLLALVIGMVPSDVVAEDHADLIELNHFFDGSGRKQFDQLIFWEWCPVQARYRVVAWRFCKRHRPQRDWIRGGFVVTWYDGDRLRRIRAPHYRETWTQYDPELQNRQHWALERRRGLRR